MLNLYFGTKEVDKMDVQLVGNDRKQMTAGIKMNNISKFVAVLKNDRKLLAMFSGLVLDAVILIGLAVTAGIWYL